MEFNVGMFLTKRAQRNPHKPGLIFEGRPFSFSEFNERSNSWANAFNDFGLKKGDRVGMLLTNQNAFLEVFFGLAKIGAVLVPLNVRLAPPELEYICKVSGLKSLVFDTEFIQTVETIRSEIDVNDYVGVGSHAPNWAKDEEFIERNSHSEPKLAGAGNDPAVILYTSGTTGHPKGVVRDHLSFLWLAAGLTATLDYPSEERALVVVPLCHGWGLNFVVTAVHRAGTSVLMKAFNAHHALETIRKEKVEAFLVVPRMLQQIALVPNFETYLSGLRILETTQDLLSQLDKWLGKGIVIRRGYGLTEAGYVTTVGGSDAVKKPDSQGLPLFCTEVRIVDEEGVDLPSGEVGEILVKGPTVMKQYWGDPDATAEAIRDGWLHTDDLGKLGEDGLLYIIDRVKDLIKSGGESIYPAEVEKVLIQHPKILDVAVIGQTDVVWGEKVCAIVRPREGASLTVEDVSAFCHGKVARFKIPKEVILMNTPLPHDSSGKLLRGVLRDRLNLEENRTNLPDGPLRSKSSIER
jgi:fatty-acyl-CoA synthase